MATDLKQIVAAVMVLAILAAIWFSIVSIVLWVISRTFRWLYSYSWFARKVLWAQETLQRWWDKSSPEFRRLWEFFSEIFIDPLFYGYALVVVVQRLQSISQYIKQFPSYNYFQILDLDMNADPNFYYVFLIIFTLWMFSKIWKRNQDVRDKMAVSKSLKYIENKLGHAQDLEEVGMINKKMRDNLRRINGR